MNKSLVADPPSSIPVIQVPSPASSIMSRGLIANAVPPMVMARVGAVAVQDTMYAPSSSL